VYLRVASARHEDHGKVEHQRQGCRQIAERHGLTIIREYADVGRAGRLDQQIELLRLLADLREKRDVASVIVWDYAWLGRSMEQLEQVSHYIRSCGAQIVTITGMEAAERFLQERGLTDEQPTVEDGRA
jgi:DNA invertase Pin-like site-specific DNA recombinase